MLNEFDPYLDRCDLSKKARNDRQYWNHSIKVGRKPAQDENRQWKPAVADCRDADDLVIMVKGSKREAQAIGDQCRDFLKNTLKLTLNMENTHITHVNDGVVCLGHRIIPKRGPKGNMRVVSGRPKSQANALTHSLSQALTGDHGCRKIDKGEQLNRTLAGWAQFYRHTDFTAKVYSQIDRVVFWKLAHWLARKHRCRIRTLLKRWYKRPQPDKAKTWVLFGKTNRGH